jgi:hypothetical protein
VRLEWETILTWLYCGGRRFGAPTEWQADH